MQISIITVGRYSKAHRVSMHVLKHSTNFLLCKKELTANWVVTLPFLRIKRYKMNITQNKEANNHKTKKNCKNCKLKEHEKKKDSLLSGSNKPNCSSPHVLNSFFFLFFLLFQERHNSVSHSYKREETIDWTVSKSKSRPLYHCHFSFSFD